MSSFTDEMSNDFGGTARAHPDEESPRTGNGTKKLAQPKNLSVFGPAFFNPKNKTTHPQTKRKEKRKTPKNHLLGERKEQNAKKGSDAGHGTLSSKKKVQ